MIKYVPGTAVEYDSTSGNDIFAPVAPYFSMKLGMTLGQIRELTGLESSTIQNWVKRGWVANPVNRRYGQRQLARIIFINCLRTAISLEKIPRLMAYLNGSVEDKNDDIIDEAELYEYFCRTVVACDEAQNTDKDVITAVIAEHTCNYSGTAEHLEKVRKALFIMTYAFISARLMEEADRLYCEIIEPDDCRQ